MRRSPGRTRPNCHGQADDRGAVATGAWFGPLVWRRPRVLAHEGDQLKLLTDISKSDQDAWRRVRSAAVPSRRGSRARHDIRRTDPQRLARSPCGYWSRAISNPPAASWAPASTSSDGHGPCGDSTVLIFGETGAGKELVSQSSCGRSWFRCSGPSPTRDRDSGGPARQFDRRNLRPRAAGGQGFRLLTSPPRALIPSRYGHRNSTGVWR